MPPGGEGQAEGTARQPAQSQSPPDAGSSPPDWGTVELAGLFPEIFDAAPDAIVVVDERGTIVLANRQSEAMFGYERSELIGEKVEILVPEGLRKDHVEHRDRYMKDPERRPMGAELELEAVKRDGTRFPVEISLSPLQTERGLLVMAAVRDVADRQRAQQRFRDLIEAAPDAIVLVDGSGEITLVNEQAEAMFGYERSELIGEKVEALVPEGLREEHVGHREGYIEDPETRPMGVDLDLSAVRADGSEFPVEISLAPLEGEDGTEVMAAVRDMTERRQIEQKLREYAEQLERSNEDWEHFAHVISHDLKEPIRMVQSYLDLLETRYGDKLEDDAEEFMNYAVEGAGRMKDLIDGLLAYSRVQQESSGLEPVDPADVIENILDTLQIRIEETDADVDVGTLPTVKADRAQLAQVFQNLIENALKFSGEETPAIEIRAEKRDGMVRFEVEDHGVGIEPELQEKIFEIFHGSSADEGGGRGIGLSVCSRILQRHGGEIGVDSVPGEGSTFWFTLPAAGQDTA